MTCSTPPRSIDAVPDRRDAKALVIDDLSLGFRSHRGLDPVLHHVSLDIDRGEIVGLVGESGSGKSVTSLQVARLLPEESAVVSGGDIRVGGISTLAASARAMNRIRGRHIGFVFQEPMSALNPTMTIGRQLALVIRRHVTRDRHAVRQRVLDALDEVRLPRPEVVARQYPFELSGGMRQRVVIALAMIARPMLLIADEPTTALDVTVQAEILTLIRNVTAEHGTAVLFISHDLAVISELAHRVFVMYEGEVVEQGPTRAVIDDARHPYTRALIAAIPSIEKSGGALDPVPGEPAAHRTTAPGCVFERRCPLRFARCSKKPDRFEVAPGHVVACWLASPGREDDS